MPNIPVPQFPSVPDLPGVPALVRQVGAPVLASVNAPPIESGLGQSALGFGLPVWGVFDSSGAPVAIADSFVDMDFTSDSKVSNYPQEQGAFQSYNKVMVPYESKVTLACGGDDTRRTQFLAAIDDAQNSTNLYRIITPNDTRVNANILRYSYRRQTRNGATLLLVELAIEEIRLSAQTQFANVQNPASSDPISVGQVQALPPSAAQAALYGPVGVTGGFTPSSTSLFSGGVL
jgi:hypothetical protein